jgi:hypothetical protein
MLGRSSAAPAAVTRVVTGAATGGDEPLPYIAGAIASMNPDPTSLVPLDEAM